MRLFHKYLQIPCSHFKQHYAPIPQQLHNQIISPFHRLNCEPAAHTADSGQDNTFITS